MAKILAPNEQYSGISAGVTFTNGVGETSNPELIKWFKRTGYEVEEPEEGDEFQGMTVDQLKAYAEAKNIDTGNATSVKGIIKKIKESEQEAGE